MASSIRQLKPATVAPVEANSPAPESWSEVLRQYQVDEVVAVSAWDQSAIWNELSEACADRGVIFRQLVVMPKPKVGRYHIEDAGNGSYFVSLETVPQEQLTLAIKRVLDIVGALFGVTMFALVYPFYALWLRIVSPGPTLFRQERLGRNGRFFTLYKFRTMRPDAESQLHALMGRNEMSGALFKIKDDPRIVTGGTFMRRTHLDELPQFWNVLLGDMSLVGTRPPTRLEVESYENRHYRRLSVRPGITGMWQVTGNGEVHDFEEVVKLDCQYIDNWSLGLDLKLIAKTIVKVIRFGGW
jgi:lipopolysaccharide/colanic/teichoic acid biosynthesis glycosyltransferase